MIIVSIFLLGLAVTLVIAKGTMQARDYAAEELEKQQASDEEKPDV